MLLNSVPPCLSIPWRAPARTRGRLRAPGQGDAVRWHQNNGSSADDLSVGQLMIGSFFLLLSGESGRADHRASFLRPGLRRKQPIICLRRSGLLLQHLQRRRMTEVRWPGDLMSWALADVVIRVLLDTTLLTHDVGARPSPPCQGGQEERAPVCPELVKQHLLVPSPPSLVAQAASVRSPPVDAMYVSIYSGWTCSGGTVVWYVPDRLRWDARRIAAFADGRSILTFTWLMIRPAFAALSAYFIYARVARDPHHLDISSLVWEFGETVP